jgi:hypothetical protein
MAGKSGEETMWARSVEGALRRAIEERRVVSLVDGRGRRRMVEPHLLFQTEAGEHQVEVYQVSGETSAWMTSEW